MKTYDVTVTRDGKWWMVEIPEIDGLTQARRLDEAEDMAREYVAVTLDLPLSEVRVAIASLIVDGHDVFAAKRMAVGLREQAKAFEELALAFSRTIAETLTAAQVPVRDVSSILGVSHQRVSQIVNAGTASPRHDLSEGAFLAEAVLNGERIPDIVIKDQRWGPIVVELKDVGAVGEVEKIAKGRIKAATKQGARQKGSQKVTGLSSKSGRLAPSKVAAKSARTSAGVPRRADRG